MNTHQLKRIIANPARAVQIIQRRVRSLRWESYARRVPDPKSIKPANFQERYVVTEGLEEKLEQQIRDAGIPISSIALDAEAFETFANGVRQRPAFDAYLDFYSHHWAQKLVEMFLTDQRGTFGKGARYLDVGCEHSCIAGFFREKYDAEVYELDLQNQPGIHGHKIGANAREIPMPDASVSGMFLHCSFEHFEDDADVRFFGEVNRLLCGGGWVLIVPLYLYTHNVVLTDPVMSIPAGLDLAGRHVFCIPRWWNRFGRMYAPATLKTRLLSLLAPGRSEIIKIENHKAFTDLFHSWISPYAFWYCRD